MPSPVRAETGKISSPTSSSAAAVSAGGARAVEAVDLVDGDGDRQAGGAQRGGDEAVAGADALLAVDDEQGGVGVGQLALDAALHALGERVARALHAGQVDEHELVPRAGGDAADRPARRLRLVGDDRHLLADEAVDERRLADVRPPGERDEPRARAGAPGSPGQQLRLEGEHLALVGLVVHPHQVQGAVDDGLAQVGRVGRADDDVAQLARPGARLASSTGKEARRSARPCRGARR